MKSLVFNVEEKPFSILRDFFMNTQYIVPCCISSKYFCKINLIKYNIESFSNDTVVDKRLYH